MSKKKTQREFYNEILANYDLTPEHEAFIKGRLEALDRKSTSGSKKPTATQVANEGIKEAIIGNMVEGVDYSITDMIKSFPECADLTNQKVSALVRQLKEANLVERIEGKNGKALFRLV